MPLDGVFPLSQSLDHAGPLARSVEDAALALAVLAGMPAELPKISLAGLRLGLVARHFNSTEITPGVRACLDEALARFRAAGANLIELEIPRVSDANMALGTILRPEASLIHAQLMRLNSTGYAPQTLAQLQAGRSIPAVDYLAALAARDAIRLSVERQFDTVAGLISPSVPFIAPFTDPVIEEGEDGEMLSSGLANLTGHPAISLPIGLCDDLPVGLQLTGPLGRDDRLLVVAGALELALGWDTNAY